MKVSLATVGGACAVLMVACFVVGVALMAGSGVQVLIPETGTRRSSGSPTWTRPAAPSSWAHG